MLFHHESVIPAKVEEVFAFHERRDALALLQPPWERVVVKQPPSGLEVGVVVRLTAFIGPFPMNIVAEHTDYKRNAYFEDRMLRGPFTSWRHRHVFESVPEGCRLRDEIEYTPPFGFLGRMLAPVFIEPRLQRLFAYRHRTTQDHVLKKAALDDVGDPTHQPLEQKAAQDQGNDG